jgi:predicted ester cyclase
MATNENRALTERVFEALSQGNLAVAEEVLAPPLRKFAAASAKAAHGALPDLRVQLEETIAEGDKVVAVWRATGTQKGAGTHSIFGAVKPTGKQIDVSGVTILQFANGQVIQTWGLTDELAGAVQLGLVQRHG